MTLLEALARRIRGCPPGWHLTQAVTGDAPTGVEQHLRACRRCADEVDALSRVAYEARWELPTPEPMTDAERRAISAHLLAAPAPIPRRSRRSSSQLVAPVVTIAGLAIVFVRLRSGSAPSEVHPAVQAPSRSFASVRATGATRFARIQGPPDEVLQLDDGSLELAVDHLAPGERFRVVTEDADVEVRGTHFRVAARAHHLSDVHVTDGRVAVRPVRGGIFLLEAGDTWEPSLATESPSADTSERSPDGEPHAGHRRRADILGASGSARARSAPGIAGSEESRAAAPPSPASALFDRGWTLLRAGHGREAAQAFEEVERVAVGTGLEEDAAYWRAVATARSRTPEAPALYQAFLDRFPKSSRAGAAAVALGWLRLDARDSAAARRLFTRALDDPSAEVVGSARRGIEACGD